MLLCSHSSFSSPKTNTCTHDFAPSAEQLALLWALHHFPRKSSDCICFPTTAAAVQTLMSWFLQRGKTQWWWRGGDEKQSESDLHSRDLLVPAERESRFLHKIWRQQNVLNVMLFQELFLHLISRNGTRSHVAHVQIHKYRILYSVISACEQNIVFFFHVFTAVSYLKAEYQSMKNIYKKRNNTTFYSLSIFSSFCSLMT